MWKFVILEDGIPPEFNDSSTQNNKGGKLKWSFYNDSRNQNNYMPILAKIVRTDHPEISLKSTDDSFVVEDIQVQIVYASNQFKETPEEKDIRLNHVYFWLDDEKRPSSHNAQTFQFRLYQDEDTQELFIKFHWSVDKQTFTSKSFQGQKKKQCPEPDFQLSIKAKGIEEARTTPVCIKTRYNPHKNDVFPINKYLYCILTDKLGEHNTPPWPAICWCNIQRKGRATNESNALNDFLTLWLTIELKKVHVVIDKEASIKLAQEKYKPKTVDLSIESNIKVKSGKFQDAESLDVCFQKLNVSLENEFALTKDAIDQVNDLEKLPQVLQGLKDKLNILSQGLQNRLIQASKDVLELDKTIKLMAKK